MLYGGSRGARLLFVYGTLRPGMDVPMARRLRQLADHLGPARSPGRLYDLGPYPGMREALRAGDWVMGDLFRLSAPGRTLRELDLYEGGPGGRGRPEYERVLRPVYTAGGRMTRAWLYLYTRPVAPSRRIARGDYSTYRDQSVPLSSSPRRWCQAAIDSEG